jgi:predicted ArsR family transcriptional regulator
MNMDSPPAESSREQILSFLRRKPRSVNDLASALGVTDNAVRANLARLERDGLIRQVGRRPGVRKPEHIYDITSRAEHAFGNAYAPVMEALLTVLESNLGEAELDAKLREVGSHLAAVHLPKLQHLPFHQRVDIALKIVEDLGGLAVLDRRDDRLFVAGFGCPFSAIVNRHPKLCMVLQQLMADLLGRNVQEQCERGERSRCCFLVE